MLIPRRFILSYRSSPFFLYLEMSLKYVLKKNLGMMKILSRNFINFFDEKFEVLNLLLFWEAYEL